MRIIAGQYRGRRLITVRDRTIRPTTDRAKQTVFDVLANRLDFNGIDVLDLFAGSGGLGLEALSRGAKSVTFVEKAHTSTAVLEKNIDSLGCRERTTIHPADVFWFLKNAHRPFDLIFADPPFGLETIGAIPTAIASSRAVHPGTYVVMEHGKNDPMTIPSVYETVRKQFGQTTVLILEVAKNTPDMHAEGSPL